MILQYNFYVKNIIKRSDQIMKPKFKRLSKKLISIFTALSLTFAMFVLPGSLSENVKAGTLVNIVTGKWAAIGLEYFE